MEIRELTISGAYEISPNIHRDSRGAFLEWFRADRMCDAIGHHFTTRQANCSVSSAGVVRGIHFADVPPGQAKYVTCPSGALLDVVVDLRRGSPTYGVWESVLLDDENRKAVYVGEGLGHAFMALSADTVIQYLCSTTYAPEREHGINPQDKTIGIEWPTKNRDGEPVQLLVSDADRNAPSLAEAEATGLLPQFEDTMTYVASLG